MRRFLFSLCVGLALVAGAGNSFAQSATQTAVSVDIPRTLSYQGAIVKDGQPVKDGDYAITVNLYSDKDGSHSLWHATYTTHVTNGVFSVQLGSGDTPLPAASAMDGSVFAGITLNGEEMKPLTPLSAVPYAINVADGAITAKKMGTDYVGSITVNGQKVSGKGADLNIVTNGIQASLDPGTNTLVLTGAQPSGAITTKGEGDLSNTTINGTLHVTGTTQLDDVLNMTGKKIQNLATPVSSTDAATKAYVDSHLTGGSVTLDPVSAQASGTANSIDIAKASTAGNFLHFNNGGANDYSWAADGNLYTGSVNTDQIGDFSGGGLLINPDVQMLGNLDVASDATVEGTLFGNGSGLNHVDALTLNSESNASLHNAGALTGTYAALNGSAITGITVDMANLTGTTYAAGNGANITNISGGNVSGAVANATHATNVSGGAITSETINATVTGNGSGITNVNAASVNGEGNAALHDAGSLTGTYAGLNGSAITNITGGNVSGAVANATHATNVSGGAITSETINATVTGNGSGITNVNAASLNGEGNAALHDAGSLTGSYAALNGSAITNINGGNVSTVANATHATNVSGGAITSETINATVTGNGSGITNVNAASLNGEGNAALHDAGSLTGLYAALNGSAITNITGGNVSGAVANATHATNVSGGAITSETINATVTGNGSGITNVNAASLNGEGNSALHDAGSLTGTYAALNGSAITNLTGANVNGNITGNAASITGSITESQVTNLVTDLGNKINFNPASAQTGSTASHPLLWLKSSTSTGTETIFEFDDHNDNPLFTGTLDGNIHTTGLMVDNIGATIPGSTILVTDPIQTLTDLAGDPDITTSGNVSVGGTLSSAGGVTLTGGSFVGDGSGISNLSLTTDAPLTNPGPNEIGITLADATHDGYLSMTDWNTFNSAAGGVTSFNTRHGAITLLGSDIPDNAANTTGNAATATTAAALNNTSGAGASAATALATWNGTLSNNTSGNATTATNATNAANLIGANLGGDVTNSADNVTVHTYNGGTSFGSMAHQGAGAVAITGGTIDGTTIGGTTAAAGSFTNVSASGMVTIGTTGAPGTLKIYDSFLHHSSSITQADPTSDVSYTIPGAATGSKFMMVAGGTGTVPDPTLNDGLILEAHSDGSMSWASPGATYTDAMARAAVAPQAPLSFVSNQLVISQANSSTNGYLSSTDWTTFNNKQNALTTGDLTTSTSGVTVTGGAGAVIGSGASLNIATSDGSHNGLLASGDWTTFNNKVSSSRAITTTNGTLTGGGDLSADRDLSLNLAHANTWSATQTFGTAKATTMQAPVSGNGTSGNHGQAFTGQATFTWANVAPNTSTAIIQDIYNDNITDNSIILFNVQGSTSGNGVFVGEITTAPNGTNHNFRITLQRRVSGTLSVTDVVTVNYMIIN